MKRYPLSFRSQAYNEGRFYELVPVARKIVAPGESISTLVVDMRFISAVFPKVVTTPVLAQMWAFYVPHRLVWNQWVDFVALDDAVTSIPTTTGAWPAMFDPGTGAKSTFARRSYKLIYNSYFGDEKEGSTKAAWYDDISNDVIAVLHRLLAWDQQRTSQTRTAAYTQSTFAASVAGAVATINLDEFARALRNSTARRRQKASGDKYVDTMRLMGVELDWKIQNVPEYLGSCQGVIAPRERASSNDTNLSARVSEWSGKLSLTSKRRMAFAEHGYIMVLAGFRPAYMVNNSAQLDNSFVGPFDFFRPDAVSVMENATASTGTMRERYSGYLKGFNVIGDNANGNVFAIASPAETFYPDPAGYVVNSGSGPAHMAWTADISMRGLTPVPSSRT